jgi:general secretion pathway protein L
MGIDAGQSFYLSSQTAKIQEEQAALYRQLFPKETRIVDPVQQMRTHLSSASGESLGALRMLQELAAHWPVQDASAIQMKSIAYHDEDHSLTLSVEARNMEALNRLARQVDGSELKARLVSVVNGENNVKGQLALKEAGR